MDGYRSGHNGAVLKTVRVQAHGGSNPSPSVRKACKQAVCRLFIFGILEPRKVFLARLAKWLSKFCFVIRGRLVFWLDCGIYALKIVATIVVQRFLLFPNNSLCFLCVSSAIPLPYFVDNFAFWTNLLSLP